MKFNLIQMVKKFKFKFKFFYFYILADLTSSYTVLHLACSVYIQCLSLIPALVREWYYNRTKRIRDAVDRVTQKFVSPILIQQELDSASALKEINVGETGLFTVKKHSNTREITAIYNIETSRVEICIRLPINYPLSNTNIECTHHIGFTKEQWNKWMLQLKTNLTQNVMKKEIQKNSLFLF